MTTPKTLIANFKSNKTRSEYEQWLNTFEPLLGSLSSINKIILAPPTVDLMFFSNRMQDKQLYKTTELGVQDLSSYPAGAYTGAISTRNLEGFGVSYAILGHSERRVHFHETVQDVALKVGEALNAKIKPIVCVRKEDIAPQANALGELRSQVMVAFEPVANIGTGIADTLDDILTAKQLVTSAFGAVPYIYGGSVDLHTEPGILHHPDIDGFLVGTACLDPNGFASLIQLL